MAYYVTLIHGTFSPDAAWIQKDSFFASELAKALDTEVRFDKFNWGGRNLHTERIKQGKQLAEKIKNNLLQYPNYDHVIIAHSHGGNVVLYALNYIEDVPANLFFVSLATPFLNCTERNLPFNTQLFKRYFKIVLGIFQLFALLQIIVFIVLLVQKDFKTITAYWYNWFFLLMPIVCQRVGNYIERYYFRQGQKAQELMNILSRSYNIKMAAFTTGRDEALLGLNISKRIPEGLFSLRKFFEKITKLTLPYLKKLFVSILVLGLILAILQDIIHINGEQIFMTIGFIVSILLILVVAGLMDSVTLGVMFSYMFKSPAFGLRSLGYLLHLKIEPSKFPIGIKYPFIKDYNPIVFKKKWYQLNHSQLYESKDVINDIANWIKKCTMFKITLRRV